MRKKRIITSIVVVIGVLVGIFFIIKFGVIGRIDDAISRYFVQNQSDKEVEEELMYETEHDKDGNEYVVKYKKQIVKDEEGNEFEMWEDTAEPKIIDDNFYKGKIEKIEDNKIYFLVDKEDKSGGGFSFKDVEDYEIVFDINTYDFEDDPSSHYWCDSLSFRDEDFWGGSERFHSADALEFLVGEYLRVQDSMFEDYYTGNKNKLLIFYLK